jgi:hypothetical protein
MLEVGYMEVIIEQVTASTAPVKETGTNDSDTPRTCDSATPTAVGPSSHTHDHVKAAWTYFISCVTEVTWK